MKDTVSNTEENFFDAANKNISPEGQSAMQGKKWTPKDGTHAHQYYELAVEDALDQTAKSNGACREVYSEMTNSAGTLDTYIRRGEKGIVIDYKTHDMTEWPQADALREGKKQGEQVLRYLTAICKDENILAQHIHGYVIHTGKPPNDMQVLNAYRSELNDHNIGLAPCKDGDAKSVVNAVKKLVNKHSI
jgi:hypothetical protein